jgi:hypothetical protein
LISGFASLLIKSTPWNNGSYEAGGVNRPASF